MLFRRSIPLALLLYEIAGCSRSGEVSPDTYVGTRSTLSIADQSYALYAPISVHGYFPADGPAYVVVSAGDNEHLSLRAEGPVEMLPMFSVPILAVPAKPGERGASVRSKDTTVTDPGVVSVDIQGTRGECTLDSLSARIQGETSVICDADLERVMAASKEAGEPLPTGSAVGHIEGEPGMAPPSHRVVFDQYLRTAECQEFAGRFK
jgi:hypothetical protein